MLRLGIISELGTGENLGYARVSFDEVGMVSGWLPLPSTSTKTAKVWHPIEVNSQVACLMDNECEQGSIVAALWSDTDTPPDWSNENTVGIQFSDGAKLYYDSNAHKLFFDAPETDIEINCSKLKITGDIEQIGDMSVTGTVKADTDVRVGMVGMGTSLSNHMHGNGNNGAATTPPQPPS